MTLEQCKVFNINFNTSLLFFFTYFYKPIKGNLILQMIFVFHIFFESIMWIATIYIF